jgi:hypothetical protein
MVQSVLGSLVLGYRPLWNAARKLAGVQLYVHSDAQSLVDAPHLLRTVSELWTAGSPPLLLSPRSIDLLAELLMHAPAGAPWIAVSGHWLADPAIARHARGARARGLRLVWDGPLDHLPDPDTASLFDNSLLQLSSQDAVVALRAGSTRTQPGAQAPYNPVIAEQMYDNVASRALLSHCLDHSGALAVAGWPADDVLHSLRHQTPQPAHEVVLQLLKAIDQEHSIDSLEQILSEDPLLAYRFMTYTNSAALGLRSGVDSLRRALVMMGYGSLSRWLGEMLPHCSTEPDLRPIREATVLRARLSEQLMNAGEGKELRREVYLCGLFSQLGELLREPLGTVLRRLPLSERVYNATVLHSGPYAPCLDMACALEGDDAGVIRQLCETHELEQEDVNRALLRVLSEQVVERPGRR